MRNSNPLSNGEYILGWVGRQLHMYDVSKTPGNHNLSNEK